MYYVCELLRLRLVVIQVPKFLPAQTKGTQASPTVRQSTREPCANSYRLFYRLFYRH